MLTNLNLEQLSYWISQPVHVGLDLCMVSLRCFEAMAHQSSLYGSGPASRCTFATVSSIFCKASVRHSAKLCWSAQLRSSISFSATLRQSLPMAELFRRVST